MKKRVYILTAVVSYLLFLIAGIPAKAVIDQLDQTNVSFKGISGTVWNGKAYKVTINRNVQLTDTQWSFNLWKLLIGQLALDVNTRYSDNDIKMEIGTSLTGRYFVNHMTGKISATDVTDIARIPLAQLSGLFSLNIEHADWKQGELPTASGQIDWQNASVTIAESVSLGNIVIQLDESEQHMLHADISNQGGDISITGSAELVPEADYAVNIRMTPGTTANNSITQSLGMFAKRQSNGSYLFNRTGPLSEIGLM